jgi:hypothetical protein
MELFESARKSTSKPRPNRKRLRAAEPALYAQFFARAEGMV